MAAPTHTKYRDSKPGRLIERNNVYVRCGKPESAGAVKEPRDFYQYTYTLDPAEKIAEVRRIRREHQKEARRIGFRKYIENLNRKRGCFLGKGAKYPDVEPSRAFQVQETPKGKYGKD